MKSATQTRPRGRQPDPAARAARKEQIILAAQMVFREKGFDSAGTAEISKAAGISVAGLYQYFASKEELVFALVERELEHAIELVTFVGQQEDFFEALDKSYGALSDRQDCVSPGLRMEIFALASRNKAIRDRVLALQEAMLEKFTKVIEAAQACGQIEPTLDPFHASRMVQSASESILVQLCFPEDTQKRSRLATLDLLRKALSPK